MVWGIDVCYRLPILMHLWKLYFRQPMIQFKGCLVWGSRTSILTSYLESAGLFTPGVKFSSYSDQPLSRYYSIQTGSEVGTENHNLGNPFHLMTQRSHTPISHNAKNGFFKLFLQGAHQFLDNSVTECSILMPIIGSFSLSLPSLFQKLCFKFIL